MYKISLINMPFANLRLPSIALTQLRSVLEKELGDQVRVRILYLNHDFAHFLGLDLYQGIAGALEANNSGIGDWFFRQAAFPRLPDNAEAYFQRYFPSLTPERAQIRQQVLAKRSGLERFLQKLVMQHKLDQEDLVGFTSMFAQNTACFALARLVKERRREAVTVMGGANCEAPMGRELARHLEAVDFVFSGPALVSFPELVRCRIEGRHDDCHRIQGVFSRSNVDSLEGHNAIGKELPIDVPVALDYDSFLADLSRSFPNGRIEPYLLFETSRGCWWGERSHCTFCGLNGGTMMYRSMPPEQALALFRNLFERYGDRCRRFESVDNILPREYLTDVLPHLATPPGVSLFYEVKADLKEREMEVLSKAGVTAIQPGIEALSTSTLRLMGKGTTSFQNLAFLKNCVRFGITPSWNLLIGFPGETEEVYRKYLDDLPLLAHLPPPSGAFPVRFDRYSPYFTRSAEYKLDLAPYDFYGAIYPFGDEALANMAYYFQDRRYADYMDQLITWQGRLATAVAAWSERWLRADGGLAPELAVVRTAGGAFVRDTRSGAAVEHPLDDLGLRILELLNEKGWRPADVARQAGAGEEEVAAEMERLAGLGLLFEENGRWSSLVILERDGAVDMPGAVLAATLGTVAAERA
ncbi:MAG: RiPP maturation radical SAM C-methyltransferase [Acidobacteriota bacterium]